MTNEVHPPLFLHLIPSNLSFNYLLMHVNPLIFGLFIGSMVVGKLCSRNTEWGESGRSEQAVPFLTSCLLSRRGKQNPWPPKKCDEGMSDQPFDLPFFLIADANWEFLS